MMMMTTVMTAGMDAQVTQRNAALKRANEIRTTRKNMREEAKEHRLDVGDVLLAPPAVLDTAKIGDIVMWVPGVGEWRMKRILHGLARPNVKVSHLGEATRRRIVDRLRDGCEWNAYHPL
jgi:hypothetical protein